MATQYEYGGNAYSLNPQYNLASKSNPYGNFTGYQIPIKQIGTSVDARTANQIKEISEHLNSGIKVVEVAAHSPEVLDAIPKDHLTELYRLSKLVGAELTMHAPMIDPSGITQHGWDKMNQKAAEAQLWNAVERSHDLNPKGNMNVTFHASTAQLPAALTEVMEDGKKKVKGMLFINESSGQIGQIKEEDKYWRNEITKDGKPIQFNAEDELAEKNKDQWMKIVTNLNFASERGTQALRYAWNQEERRKKDDEEIETNPLYNFDEKKLKEYENSSDPDIKNQAKLILGSKEEKKRIDAEIEHGKLYLLEAYRNTKELFNDIYKNASPKNKEKLRAYAESIAPQVENFEKINSKEQLKEFADTIEQGVKAIRDVEPQMFVPLRDFAIKKTAETTSNIAFKAYKSFGDTAPIIALENHPAQQSLLTTGDDLKAVIVEARDQLKNKLIKDGKLSDSEAEKQAEKLIGATWDVGHINMLRKSGYTNKDLIEQSKTIAPYVKKVHLSDNFGFEHTELPMGMGNVPIKEIMNELGKKGFEGPKIVEALQWWQHFSQGGKVNPPFVPTMQAFGSPIYGANWNQVYTGVPGSYFGGYGTMLPDQHFQMYGAGFTSLPTELGGQISGKDSRMTGTPMS